MRRLLSLERSLGQLLAPSTPLNTCRSCQLQASRVSQQRQLQTSASQRAGFGLGRLFGGKKEETAVAPVDSAVADAQSTSVSQRTEDSKPDFPGWYLPKERELPEGWAQTPQDDSQYVVAAEGRELEHIGSEQWLDKQFDSHGKYKG